MSAPPLVKAVVGQLWGAGIGLWVQGSSLVWRGDNTDSQFEKETSEKSTQDSLSSLLHLGKCFLFKYCQ